MLSLAGFFVFFFPTFASGKSEIVLLEIHLADCGRGGGGGGGSGGGSHRGARDNKALNKIRRTSREKSYHKMAEGGKLFPRKVVHAGPVCPPHPL